MSGGRMCVHDEVEYEQLFFCIEENKSICAECRNICRDNGHKTKNSKEIGIACQKIIEELLTRKKSEKSQGGNVIEKEIPGIIDKLKSKQSELKTHIGKAKADSSQHYESLIEINAKAVKNISDGFDIQLKNFGGDQEIQKKIIEEREKDLNDIQTYIKAIKGNYAKIYDLYEKYIKKQKEESKPSEVKKEEKEVKEEEDKKRESLEDYHALKDIANQFIDKKEIEAFTSRNQQTDDPFVISSSYFAEEVLLYKLIEKSSARIEFKNYKIPFYADVLAAESCIFVIGGTEDNQHFSDTTYRYSLMKSQGDILKEVKLKEKRAEHACVYLDRRIICVGGKNEKEHLASCEELSLIPLDASKKWITWENARLNERKSFPVLCVFANPPTFAHEKDKPISYTIYCFNGSIKREPSKKIEYISLAKLKEGWKEIIIKSKEYDELIIYNATIAVQINSNDILLFGGSKETTYIYNASDQTIKNSEIVNPGQGINSKPVIYNGDKRDQFILALILKADLQEMNIETKKWATVNGFLWDLQNKINF